MFAGAIHCKITTAMNFPLDIVSNRHNFCSLEVKGYESTTHMNSYRYGSDFTGCLPMEFDQIWVKLVEIGISHTLWPES